jgi:uncharacterized protein YdeI (YjbR/CyaY-like superfamily)
MPKKDPRVDAYIAKSADFARPILTRLRMLFHKASPKIEESIKWGVPAFEYKGIVAMMAAFKQHASFGFWKEKLMQDPAKILSGKSGPMSSVRLTSVKELPPDKVLIAYIHEAIDLNERDIKPVKKKSKPKELSVPDDLRAALRRSRAARDTFEAFSPSHRNEYIEWITEAKRDETRQRRLQQTIELLAKGKSRNWKYERK